MDEDTRDTDLDTADEDAFAEDVLTYDVSDEALEAAAGTTRGWAYASRSCFAFHTCC